MYWNLIWKSPGLNQNVLKYYDLKKSRICPFLGPILPILGPNLFTQDFSSGIDVCPVIERPTFSWRQLRLVIPLAASTNTWSMYTRATCIILPYVKPKLTSIICQKLRPKTMTKTNTYLVHQVVHTTLGLWIWWTNHPTMRSPNGTTVCTTDSGVCTPSRLV